MTIFAGTAVLATGTFEGPTGAAVDPTTITVKFAISVQDRLHLHQTTSRTR